MSTTANPVTHTAEVEVKRALTGEVNCPVLLATGSISRIMPTTITLAKPWINGIIDTPATLGLGITGKTIRHGLTLATRNITSPGFRLGICCIYLPSGPDLTRSRSSADSHALHFARYYTLFCLPSHAIDMGAFGNPGTTGVRRNVLQGLLLRSTRSPGRIFRIGSKGPSSFTFGTPFPWSERRNILAIDFTLVKIAYK